MPTVTVSLPGTTFVSSQNPNANYSYYPLLYTGADSLFGTCVGYLNIPLPDLPITVVDSAKLKFSVIVKNGEAPSPITVMRATEPFSADSVTYSTQPATEPTASAVTITTADLYQTVEIDVTDLVNQWVDGTYPNDGIALVNTDTSTLVQLATNAISYQPYFPQLVITYSGSPVRPSNANNFCLAQLAYVLNQIITLYPETVVTLYTSSINYIMGTPTSLTLSPDGTYGGLLILQDCGYQDYVPLNAITAIYTGEDSVYNQNMSFLTAPNFEEGADKYIMNGIHNSLCVSESVLIDMKWDLSTCGVVYKNPYGLIVIADADGSRPLFIPVTSNLVNIMPYYQNKGDSPCQRISTEIRKNPTAAN